MYKTIFNLRNLLVITTCLAATLMFSTCNSKEDEPDPETEITTSTETTAEFDKSNFGLYKGVIAGSSGVIRIEINNGINKVEAYITVDRRMDLLMSASTFTSGQAIDNAVFTGSFSSFTFSVDADGKNPVITSINIEEHDNVLATVSKETSADVSSCYEGTATGGNNYKGVFNVVRNNNVYSTIIKGNDGSSYLVNGNIDSSGSFSGTSKTEFNGLDVTMTYSGKFNGNNVTGTWQTSWTGEATGTNSGSFSGSKTL